VSYIFTGQYSAYGIAYDEDGSSVGAYVGAIQITLTLGGRKEPRILDESLDPSRQTY